MDLSTIKNTKICQEGDSEFIEYWFGRKQKKFISHIDTLYFMIYPKVADWNKSNRKEKLLNHLKGVREVAEKSGKAYPIFENIFDGLEMKPFMHIKMYAYHFGFDGKFDVFVVDNVPSDKTPPIMVQIRAESLWLDGLYNSFNTACECVEQILYYYEIEIDKVQENRIDYAFHTNYIQDLLNFFPEKKSKEMQVSSFRRWHKEGNFYIDDVFADYFTLGRRKSNNVFFRIYNKSKEVIEMGYKQFFIKLWLDNGLISRYDEYLFRCMNQTGSYEDKDKARCKFYALYGSGFEIKDEINRMILNPDTPIKAYAEMAKGLVPDQTMVTNIEFQTKRKFYDRLIMPFLYEADKEKKSLPSYRDNIYNIFEQLQPITNFLTSNTIRFVKYKGKYASVARDKRPNADWWERLRSCKPIEFPDKWVVDYYRDYQKTLSEERQKNLSLIRLASYSAFGLDDYITEDSIESDMAFFLSGLNDNDIKKYYVKREKKANEIRRRLKNG